MNKHLIHLIGALLMGAVLILPTAAAHADTQDFTIPTFEGDYYLSRDGDHVSHLRVSEHIVAKFPQTNQNHGILRALPKSYQNHSTNLHVQSVTDDSGAGLNYSTSVVNGNSVLRIGDANKYVHDLQTYNIVYTQDNVTSTQPLYDGFFWDINGDQWQQQFGQVTARIHLTSELDPKLIADSPRCFTGPHGSTAQACTVQTTPGNEGETITTYTATRPLESGETLTAEMKFENGTFAAYVTPPAEQLRTALLLIFGLFLPVIAAPLIMLHLWRKYGRDPQGRGVIVPEYIPPQDLSVIGSSILLKENFETKAISAQIIDLAVRGYLKVYETKEARTLMPDRTVYSLELVKDPSGLGPDEQSTIRMFMDSRPVGSTVNLTDLKNQLAPEATALGKTANAALTTAGFFRGDPKRVKIPYLIAGAVLIGIGGLSAGYLLGFVFAGIVVLIGAAAMPARTVSGVERRDYLLGLKMYMTIAEADRIKAMQSPRGDLTEKIDVTDTTTLVKLYERLLPYAMLFGIEKDWAKEFAGLYQSEPSWYSGSAGFNAGYFAGSLASFSNTASASFTAPSSSGSGGFSGGGGGGGGGGGW